MTVKLHVQGKKNYFQTFSISSFILSELKFNVKANVHVIMIMAASQLMSGILFVVQMVKHIPILVLPHVQSKKYTISRLMDFFNINFSELM